MTIDTGRVSLALKTQKVISEYSLSLEGCLFSLLIEEQNKAVLDIKYETGLPLETITVPAPHVEELVELVSLSDPN